MMLIEVTRYSIHKVTEHPVIIKNNFATEVHMEVMKDMKALHCCVIKFSQQLMLSFEKVNVSLIKAVIRIHH
jgi:hypothetical protein